MNAKELARQHQQVAQDLDAWRNRREAAAGRLEAARARLEALASRRATAVAALEPDEKALGGIRRQLAASQDEVEELEAGLQAAEERIAELIQVEQALAARRQALVLVEMLSRTEARADAFARAQEAANRELELFLAAETECERFAQSLRRGDRPEFSGETLGRVALWRLTDRLSGQGAGALGWIDPSLRRPLRDFWREAWQPLRESLEATVRGH
jgi:chromosome segregation ATPase